MKDYDNFLRNIEKMNDVNDGSRSLNESIISPEVLNALNDWIDNQESECVLIGGLALSFYIKPRYTMDVDILFLSKNDIPEKVEGFKRHRKSALQHNKTHVEIELITPEIINTTHGLIKKVFETSILRNGIRIASPSGIVALKLGRFNLQDQADIAALVDYVDIDLTLYNLSSNLIDLYEDLLKRL